MTHNKAGESMWIVELTAGKLKSEQGGAGLGQHTPCSKICANYKFTKAEKILRLSKNGSALEIIGRRANQFAQLHIAPGYVQNKQARESGEVQWADRQGRVALCNFLFVSRHFAKLFSAANKPIQEFLRTLCLKFSMGKNRSDIERNILML